MKLSAIAHFLPAMVLTGSACDDSSGSNGGTTTTVGTSEGDGGDDTVPATMTSPSPMTGDEDTGATSDTTADSDGVATTDDGSSTGADTTAAATGAGSGSGTTTGAADSSYGECLEDGFLLCRPGEGCATTYTGSFCTMIGCKDVSDCPVPATGEAQPRCDDIGGGNACTLDCSEGECPDGMSCNVENGAYCEWTVAGGGGQCPDEDVGSTTPQTISGDNTGLFDEHIPTCALAAGGFGGEDAFYQFTAPIAGYYRFELSGTKNDTVLFLMDSCGGDEIACNVDIGRDNSLSAIQLSLEASQSVVIGVDSRVGDVGPYTLDITQVPPPVDGNCCTDAPPHAGCEVAAVEECVCAEDDFCCNNTWDLLCVGIAVDACSADCGPSA